MKLLRSFPLMTFVLVLVSLLGFCAAQKSLEMLLLAGTLAALSWYVTEGPRGRILPKWVSNLLVIAVSVGVIVDLLVPPNDVLGVLGRFTVWLTLIKLYERRSARDHAHLMGLSLLLMLVGSLEPAAELLFGILLLVYAAIGLYVLLLFQLYAAHEQTRMARRSESPASDEALPALRPTIGRNVGLQFRLLAVAISVAGVLLSVVVFVIYPRNLGRGLFNPRLASPVKTSRVDYSDEINLTAGTRITESRRKVFELELLDATGQPVRLDAPLLLRGAALDTYRDGQWRSSDRSAGDRVDVETGPAGMAPLSRTTIPDGDRLRQAFRFRSGTETIFSLYLPVALGSEEPARIAFDPVTQTISTTRYNQQISNYTVDSILAPSDDAAKIVRGSDDPRVNRTGYYRDAFGAGEPRVRDLARSLLEDAGLPLGPTRSRNRRAWGLEAAGVFARHLQSDAFTYTLDLGGVTQEYDDPVRSFLFANRQGHCEYFASALAALCHSVNVDARVVTGYVVYEYDDSTQRYIGLASNAHAWVEVRSGRYRWTPIDPTPPAVLEPTFTDDQPLGDRLGWIYERLEDSWTATVVEFDDRAQAEFLDRLDAGWTARLNTLLDDLREWLAGVNRAFYFGSWGYVWMGTVALVVVIAMAALLRIMRRLRALRRTMQLQRLRDAEARRLLRQLGFYLDMLIALRRHGVSKPQWQPPLAFAGAVAETRPDAAALVRSITELYYAGRYGGRRLDRAEVTEARSMVQQLEQTLRTQS